jgi:hypothetical protein
MKNLSNTTTKRRSGLAVVLGLAVLAVTGSTASAINTGVAGSLGYQIKQASSVVDVVVRRGGAVRRTTVVGPRGGVASRPWYAAAPWCVRDTPAAAYAGLGRVGTIGRGAEPSRPALPSAL